jgi:superfamily I DNA/RNA helicase
MTHDQLKTLASLRYHRRLRVIGGAGTGKTWLAMEQARRLAAHGERVALVCYSRGLARYFERFTQTWKPRERPAYVGLFHRLPIGWGAAEGADDDSDYWERRLPLQLGELARAQPVAERFDAVVVDEGQDFGELWWPSLLACLREPDTGGLFVFMDEAQRVFGRRGEVPIRIPPFVLDENIRNTKRIAQLFSSLSGEQLRPRGMDAPPVRLYDVATEQVMDVVDDVVESVLDEGFAPGQVALLTTQHRHPEQRNAVEMGGWAAYWDDFFAGDSVFYGHVLGFKGLERPVVVLAVNGFKDAERAKEMLYVGLSRARTLLVVVGSRALLEQVGGGGVRSRLRDAERRPLPG